MRAWAVRLGLLAVATYAFAQPSMAADDPPVPTGMHPGGLPVALIGGGIDYKQARIAERLARDGEGEIIGYDVASEDRRPFSSDENNSTAIAEVILAEAGATSLVPVKADLSDALSVAQAIAYAAHGPSPIIALNLDTAHSPASSALGEAARHFPQRLFIIAAGDNAADLDAVATPQTGLDAGNVMIIAACDAEGRLITSSNHGANSVDIAVDVVSRTHIAAEQPTGGKASALALARVTALAARLMAVEPDLDGAGLKARILTLAKRPSPGIALPVRAGCLPEPWKHYRLE